MDKVHQRTIHTVGVFEREDHGKTIVLRCATHETPSNRNSYKDQGGRVLGEVGKTPAFVSECQKDDNIVHNERKAVKQAPWTKLLPRQQPNKNVARTDRANMKTSGNGQGTQGRV